MWAKQIRNRVDGMKSIVKRLESVDVQLGSIKYPIKRAETRLKKIENGVHVCVWSIGSDCELLSNRIVEKIKTMWRHCLEDEGIDLNDISIEVAQNIIPEDGLYDNLKNTIQREVYKWELPIILGVYNNLNIEIIQKCLEGQIPIPKDLGWWEEELIWHQNILWILASPKRGSKLSKELISRPYMEAVLAIEDVENNCIINAIMGRIEYWVRYMKNIERDLEEVIEIVMMEMSSICASYIKYYNSDIRKYRQILKCLQVDNMEILLYRSAKSNGPELFTDSIIEFCGLKQVEKIDKTSLQNIISNRIDRTKPKCKIKSDYSTVVQNELDAKFKQEIESILKTNSTIKFSFRSVLNHILLLLLWLVTLPVLPYSSWCDSIVRIILFILVWECVKYNSSLAEFKKEYVLTLQGIVENYFNEIIRHADILKDTYRQIVQLYTRDGSNINRILAAIRKGRKDRNCYVLPTSTDEAIHELSKIGLKSDYPSSIEIRQSDAIGDLEYWCEYLYEKGNSWRFGEVVLGRDIHHVTRKFEHLADHLRRESKESRLPEGLILYRTIHYSAVRNLPWVNDLMDLSVGDTIVLGPGVSTSYDLFFSPTGGYSILLVIRNLPAGFIVCFNNENAGNQNILQPISDEREVFICSKMNARVDRILSFQPIDLKYFSNYANSYRESVKLYRVIELSILTDAKNLE